MYIRFIVAHCSESCYVIMYASECIGHGISLLMLCSCISLQLQLGNSTITLWTRYVLQTCNVTILELGCVLSITLPP